MAASGAPLYDVASWAYPAFQEWWAPQAPASLRLILGRMLLPPLLALALERCRPFRDLAAWLRQRRGKGPAPPPAPESPLKQVGTEFLEPSCCWVKALGRAGLVG